MSIRVRFTINTYDVNRQKLINHENIAEKSHNCATYSAAELMQILFKSKSVQSVGIIRQIYVQLSVIKWALTDN